jgi:hypothetical protein
VFIPFFFRYSHSPVHFLFPVFCVVIFFLILIIFLCLVVKLFPLSFPSNQYI